LQIRRCRPRAGSASLRPYRPEAEGRYALPPHAFGLAGSARGGARRSAAHRRIPAIHQPLRARGLSICARTVTNLLDRSDELLAVSLTDAPRRRPLLAQHQRVLLARDGRQPDVGPEVLWVLRDGISGEVLRAKSLRSARPADLAALRAPVRAPLPVPIAGVVSAGPHAIRKAGAQALPDVPQQLGPFPSLREAARPRDEAERPAKKERKKRGRGIRGIARQVETRDDPEAEAIRG
jgi:hypothetical protein